MSHSTESKWILDAELQIKNFFFFLLEKKSLLPLTALSPLRSPLVNQVGFKIHINEDVLVRGVSFGLEANKRPMNALGGVSSIRGSDWKDCSYESSWPGAVGIAVSWESDKEKDLI